MRKYKLKYVGWIFVAIVFCGTIWFLSSVKEQKQVKQLEERIGEQYIATNDLLRNTVDELLEWNFNQPLKKEDEDYIFHLLRDFSSIKDLFFSRRGYMVHPVHPEWQDRMEDIDGYLSNYANEISLTEDDVADLYQALQACLYISMDFEDYMESSQNFYDAMHNEQHEMVNVVKNRLAATY